MRSPSFRLVRGTLAAAAVFLACVRAVTPSSQDVAEPRRAGEACEHDTECATGFCSQGACCQERCDSPLEGVERSCNLPGVAGTCREKRPGGTCTGDEACPAEAPRCVDGVCCDAPCDGGVGACISCINAGAVGRCTTNADNTDPRHECGGADAGLCLSCTAGRCMPSLAGTDPEHECGGSLVCHGTSACATGPGNACNADAECAGNLRCVARRCRSVELGALPLPVAFPVNVAVPLALAANAEGQVTVALRSGFRYWAQATTRWKTQMGPLMTLVETGSGAVADVLQPCCTVDDSAAVSRVGGRSVVAWATTVRAGNVDCSDDALGWTVVDLGGSGASVDPLLPQPAANPAYNGAVAVALSAQGDLHVLLTPGTGDIQVATRSARTGAWTAASVPGTADTWGLGNIVLVDDRPVVVDFAAAEPQLRLTRMDGSTVRATFPGDCGTVDRLTAVALPGRPGGILAVFACDTGTPEGLHAPGVALADLTAGTWTAPGFVTLVGETDADVSLFGDRNARDAVAAPLPDGTPGVVFVDGIGGVAFAADRGDGTWGLRRLVRSTNGSLSENLSDLLYAEGLQAHTTQTGVVAVWQQAVEDDDDAYFDARLVRARIHP